MHTDSLDTRYPLRDTTLTLRSRLYDKRAEGRIDDGIVDPVAIDRFIDGHHVPLTSREVVCAVARLAELGETDGTIAERFGRERRSGRDWVRAIRKRNGIAAAEPEFDDAWLWALIAEPSRRDPRNRAASSKRLAAAGVTS